MNNSPIIEPVRDEALDIQHDTDPAKDHGPAKRIPHLGHALLFFSLASTWLAFCALGFAAAAHIQTDEAARQHPALGLAAQALGYLLTLLTSFWLFPRLWERSFLHGIQWNVLAAHRRWMWIVPAAIAVSFASQGMDRFLPPSPISDPITEIMHTSLGAWAVTIFGVLLAPLGEEIAFRGFLLPAFATAYDWLSLERTPAGLSRWENSSGHTRSAVIFAAIFSSIPFALLHAGQLSHNWGAVGVIYTVSLIFSYVRVRTHSVACSTLMHATYNLTIFAIALFSTGGYRHLERLNS
ncbi:CPBP family intramembrane glutamic endopeptidase [Granulicella mallensis]|uniref:CAAX prenyl protease 2/Lysostaphin resistance protein A-like domain-containing protein n=1 Tax=Granulicella mallensis TaxID=940614 RepID=A0A7W7ZKS4_9BACT|nr:type II CAAX endopeptidase family protein [Granulicella mallensis]MBB5061702.1 hypothetical protein [Granulicella mallensis]